MLSVYEKPELGGSVPQRVEHWAFIEGRKTKFKSVRDKLKDESFSYLAK